VRALQIAEELNTLLEARHVAVLYAIAGLHCRLGNRLEAYEWLYRAAEAGFWDPGELAANEDFQSIRAEPPFREVVKSVHQRIYLSLLEREQREEWQRPKQVLAALSLREGERIADIGAGSGYFTLPLARAVGPTGRVYACDIEPAFLDHIARRARLEGLEQITCQLADAGDPHLPQGEVDTILMVDTYHYLRDREAYLRVLRRCLAPGGRIVIIDYIPRERDPGAFVPALEHQLSRETIDADMAAAGLAPEAVHEFLPEQYFVEYRVR
jgi:ubiquinone/menaquinone biosynthesis C-methylase UbiE